MNIFGKKLVILRFSGGKPDIAVTKPACAGVIDTGKDTFKAVLTDKYIHVKYLFSMCNQGGGLTGQALCQTATTADNRCCGAPSEPACGLP